MKKSTPWAGKRAVPADAGLMAKLPKRSVAVEAIVVNLPIPPSVNELFFNAKPQAGVKRKGRISTPKYLRWQVEAIFDCRKQVNTKIDGKYTIEIEVPRHKTKADIWNLEKAISDLLQKEKIIANDKFCEGGSIRWSDDLDLVQVTLRAA